MNRYSDSHLCKCGNCGFVFSIKIPTPLELVSFYDNEYDLTRYFSPVTKKRYEELLDLFEPYRKTNKILDIGCGYGFFLEVAKEKGWEVYGVDLSKKAALICESKGITTHNGTIETSDFTDESFDVVIGIEVLEHVNTPNSFIEQTLKTLRKGGVTYITTPNFNSYLRYKLKEKYDVIDYPNHLCYFTSKTLRKAFEDKGFTTKSIKTTGISVTRVKTSKGKSNQEFVSETSDDEMLRYRIEKNAILRGTKHAVNFGLSSVKIGHNIKGFFIKKN